MKVYMLKVYETEDKDENKSEIIGIFSDINEMAEAMLQHREELNLSKWADSVRRLKEYMDETPLDGNELISKGQITDYELNIDYTEKGQERYPSYNKRRKENKK